MRLALAVAAVLFVACGGDEKQDPVPKVTELCTEGGMSCANPTTLLVCEAGKFRTVPCRGPAGCTSSSTTVSCDVSRNLAGDACPKANEGQAICDPANANQGLKCTNGTFQAQACKGCYVQSNQVLCQP